MTGPEEFDMNALSRITPTLLMGPGPSSVPSEVYKALAMPTIGHLDPRFITIMDEIKTMLRTVMGTKNEMTAPMSGTGSAGMEAAFVNLVEKGDPVLVLVNGVFGKRMVDVAGRLGADVEALEFDWGTPVIPEKAAERIKAKKWAIVAVVHAETSTGVRNPVERLGPLVRETGALFLVDAVTSLGGIPVEVDSIGADVCYSGTQKCLSCPPGLAPLTMSEAAIAKLRGRKTKVPNWYLDLSMIIDYWQGAKRAYHHTAPINMLYGLHAALSLVVDEGLQAAYARHAAAHARLAAGLDRMGLSLLVEKPYRLPMLNAVTVPEGVDEAAVRKRLLEVDDIEIGAGLGPLAGKIWRIGLMGHTAREENADRVLAALARALGRS
jgi:alanine-glyoxylate transaminase/serine-glyoxylate transaminase/serine-pyruvate transaminase